MTLALCLNCGAPKFGALCPCAACSAASTGDIHLDTTFSDHRFAASSLAEFGAVIRAIHRVETRPEMRFWSFVQYVATAFPDVLQLQVNPDIAEHCDAILAIANPPAVVLRPSPRFRAHLGDGMADADTGGTPRERWPEWLLDADREARDAADADDETGADAE